MPQARNLCMVVHLFQLLFDPRNALRTDRRVSRFEIFHVSGVQHVDVVIIVGIVFGRHFVAVSCTLDDELIVFAARTEGG